MPLIRFAVLKCSGLAGKEGITAKTTELEKLLRTHHLSAVGAVVLAQYDPPWTLWFMRRNELKLPVAP